MPARRTPRRKPNENQTPWFPIAIACLFAMCCASEARRRAATPNPAGSKKPRSLSFQVDPKTALWAPAKDAAEKWSAAIGRTITVTPDGDIPIFFVSQLSPPAAPTDMGYSWNGDEGRVEVLTSVPDSVLPLLILHEMGHLIRGTRGHLETNPKGVMAKPTLPGAVLTPEDIAFVCEGFDCAPPTTAP